MLLCNLPEALLDKFLDAMQTDGLRIDHKAVVPLSPRTRRKALSAGHTSRNFDRNGKDHAAQRGRGAGSAEIAPQ